MTWLQTLANKTLPDDCQITRKTGDCNTYTLVEIVKCAVVNALAHPLEFYEENYVVRSLDKDVAMPKGTEALPNDRLIIKNVTYRVIKPYSPESWEPLAWFAVVTLQE